MKKVRILSFLLLSGTLLGSSISVQSQTVYQAGTAAASLEPKSSPFSLALAGYGLPRGGRFNIKWQESALSLSHFKAKKLGNKWKSLVDANRFPPGTLSVISYKERLMALTAEDELYRLDASDPTAEWIRFANFNNVFYRVHLKAITVHKNQLYGLGKDNKIYRAVQQTEGDLTVKAVAIGEGDQSVVMVGTDLCGFNTSFITSIKQEVYKKHNIRPEAVLINASHTHFAPSTQDWTTWGSHQLPDTLYLNGVVRPAVLKAISQALKNRRSSLLSFGRGSTAIGHNRTLKGPDAPYDNALDVLQIENTADHTKSIVFLTGCHPVFSNLGEEGFTLSANYPGEARKVLEKEAGIKEAIFIQGCGGDINPVQANHNKTGSDLAADVKTILQQPMQQLSGKIDFHLDSVNFPVNRWSREQILAFGKENGNSPNDVYAEKNVRWANLMAKLDSQDKMPQTMPVYMQTFNIGNWKLVGISRETVTDYSIGIKKLWPGKLVSVAGYCNDVSSYLPTSKHINAGVYEGKDSFFWYGQPAVFPLNLYETIIDRIKSKNY
ncbi:hypothetical protein [Pedobacter heparinus]|uniref:Neutral/alkaline non-lysosomal ceramidase N-terminal domain-containing protein n=1 Tax=Pedobacter heparinus (strain ATCC 13125 / DSM 2366 / CIP 104194 / JCM 7457 / NBRC 12017 / NCIMB 9290 / NRRL B-14731 / HIM 762-3) TaxID=485917 RepID=C6XSM9_PEDHD|nr:hypothetical protein [Pedobacter heparinus]ACU05592.1 hypothetical protein Phep_3398 [Pedobacter heparinus DSM 2366]